MVAADLPAVSTSPIAGVSAAIAIESRTDLLAALEHACEVEHGLMLQYLFAAFSLKTRPDESLSTYQAEIARRWKRTLLIVAREEMVHLGLASNLLAAIGGEGWFRRPDFPVANRYFPCDGKFVDFTLERFSKETLARFLRFESPDPLLLELQLEYATIGDLYRQIAQTIAAAADGELFIGGHRRQETDQWGNRLRLPAIVDGVAALRAIDVIVEEGEGTPAVTPTSHYARFRAMASELDGTLPAVVLPVGPNPMTREPVGRDLDPRRWTLIVDPDTARAVELFDSLYVSTVMMLELLYRFPPRLAAHRGALRDKIRWTMSAVIRPLGEMLTRLPSGHPGVNAGPSFSLDGAPRLAGNAPVALTAVHERLRAAADEAQELATGPLSGRADMATRIALLARAVDELRADVTA